MVLPPTVVYCCSVKTFFSVMSCASAPLVKANAASAASTILTIIPTSLCTGWCDATITAALGIGQRLRFSLGRADEARDQQAGLVEQAHRQREQQLRQHVGRRDHRGHHESADDDVGPRLAQLL